MNEEVKVSFNSYISRPGDKPIPRGIAVKVIKFPEDEVIKVFRIDGQSPVQVGRQS